MSDEAGPDPMAALSASIDALPDLLEDALSASLPPAETLDGVRFVTGIGLSSGPARVFAGWAPSARYVPLSAVEALPSQGRRVLFSQGLSANTRILNAFRGAAPVLIGGHRASERRRAELLGPDGLQIPVLCPEAHPALVRVQAPTVATLLGLRWIAASVRPEWKSELHRVPGAVRAALDAARDLSVPSAPVHFVSAGVDPTEGQGLAITWAEGCFEGPPPVSDALELAHGPLQASYGRPRCIVQLASPRSQALFRRVEQVLDPACHELRRLEARLPAPLSWLEWSAGVLGLLESTLRSRGLQLDWPAKGRDGPLYELESLPRA